MRHHSNSARAGFPRAGLAMPSSANACPARVRRTRPTALRVALLSALCCAASAPSLALAQVVPEEPATPPNTPTDQPPGQASAEATTLDKVVVTGIRASVQSSITKKRDADIVSDVLSSDDIGDLPALSVGDAIQTIAGASTHREKGGATEISIRGLGPFLGSATFNGREATNGSGDRSVNFNQFPSELINTVSIYKTQRADFVEGGVSGTINMETVKPLSFGERRIQIEGRATYNGYDSKLDDPYGLGWRGTASYLDQFDLGGAGKLGISVGIQSLQTDDPEETFSSSSTFVACDGSKVTSTGSNCATVDAAQVNAGTPFYLIPGSRTYRQMLTKDKRDAAFAAIQWKPNEAWEVNLDYQKSQRDYVEDRSELVFSEARRGVTNPVYDPDGVLHSYSGNSSIESTSDYKTRDEGYTGGGLNVTWRPNAAWMLSGDLSYSNTLRTEKDLTTRLRSNNIDIYGNPVAGITGPRQVTYTFDDSGDVPAIVTNPLFDLNDWDNFSGVPRIRRDEQQREHTIRAARFDGAFFPESGWLTAVKFGARAADTTYNDYDDRVEINFGSADAALTRAANLACRTDFPQKDFLSSASGNTIDSWATFDSRCLFKAFTGVADTGPNPDLRNTANNDVTEKTRAVYLMGEFSSELFGLPVTGNVGARWVKTNVTSVGLRSALAVTNNPDGTVTLTSTGDFDSDTIRTSNDVLLPSLNAAFELREDLLFRVGLYRAMARPDLTSLGYGRAFNINDGDTYTSLAEALDNVTATGNPRTKPLLSWNADLSLEWYPNPDSILSAAIYYKQFNGGSISTVVDETFVIDGNSVVVPVTQSTTTDQKSDLVGVELTASHRFSYLPAPFDGLGVKANYNYAKSNYKTQDFLLGDMVDPDTGEVTPGIVEPLNIFGLSRNVASASVFYAIGPVDLQAIYNYRSDYYQKFVGGDSQNRVIQGAGTLDFRATWRLNKQLSFSFAGTNLTDEPKISYIPIKGSYHEYHSYGRQYYLGVRYRF